MNHNQITIAIDAMGGDDAPFKCLKGAEIFLSKNNNINIIFLGNKELINSTIKNHNIKLNN